MRVTILIIIVFTAFFQTAFSQFDDLLKKIPETDDLLFESAVTTNIKDAYRPAFWLKGIENRVSLNTDAGFSFNLPPGYYKYRFNTFCLHAGVYAPTEGSGYLVAPLKGSKAQLIKNILTGYYEHPEIAQEDVQRLLWGIEAGQKFSKYPDDFRLRVLPLLKPDELAAMDIDVNEITGDLLPKEVKDVLKLYGELREKLSDVNSSYEDIERLAVKNGIPPVGKGTKNIESGTWSSLGNGVYIRNFTWGYTKSDVEIYMPLAVSMQTDNSGKINSVNDDLTKIEFEDSNNLPGTIKITNNVTDENSTLNYTSDDISKINDETKEFIKLVKNSIGRKKSKELSKELLEQLTKLKTTELLLNSGKNENILLNAGYILSVNAVNSFISQLESGNKGGGEQNKAGLLDLFGEIFAPGNPFMQRLGNSGPEGGNTGEGNQNTSQNNEGGNNGNNNNGNNGNNNNGQNNQNNDKDKKNKKDDENKKKDEGKRKEKDCNKSYEVINIQQEHDFQCWAAVAGDMMNFQYGKTIQDVNEVLEKLGAYYKDLYKNNLPIPVGKLDEFAQKLGMVTESNSFPVSGIKDLVTKTGPVIVLSDVSVQNQSPLLHARIIYGVTGDCSFSNTNFRINDPAEENSYNESLSDMSTNVAKYTNSFPGYPYILHLPGSK